MKKLVLQFVLIIFLLIISSYSFGVSPLYAQNSSLLGFGDLINLYTPPPPQVETLVAIDEGPNSDGTLAKKYIEVDLTQQKMYLFQNGKVKKSYLISSGLEYPTPRGKFFIFNKATNAYSNIYHVWMPYWMGFYVDPKLHASFGIHELPYWYSQGTKVRRPRENIGSPNTGGCIALDIGKAKEVYMFADIGTPLFIYD